MRHLWWGRRVVRRPVLSQPLRLELAVKEGLRTRDIAFVQMFDDDRDVRVLFRQPLEVEVIVQLAHARSGQDDLADTAEGVGFQRVIIADVGMLFGFVVAERATSLAWAILMCWVRVSNT